MINLGDHRVITGRGERNNVTVAVRTPIGLINRVYDTLDERVTLWRERLGQSGIQLNQ